MSTYFGNRLAGRPSERLRAEKLLKRKKSIQIARERERKILERAATNLLSRLLRHKSSNKDNWKVKAVEAIDLFALEQSADADRYQNLNIEGAQKALKLVSDFVETYLSNSSVCLDEARDGIARAVESCTRALTRRREKKRIASEKRKQEAEMHPVQSFSGNESDEEGYRIEMEMKARLGQKRDIARKGKIRKGSLGKSSREKLPILIQSDDIIRGEQIFSYQCKVDYDDSRYEETVSMANREPTSSAGNLFKAKLNFQARGFKSSEEDEESEILSHFGIEGSGYEIPAFYQEKKSRAISERKPNKKNPSKNTKKVKSKSEEANNTSNQDRNNGESEGVKNDVTDGIISDANDKTNFTKFSKQKKEQKKKEVNTDTTVTLADVKNVAPADDDSLSDGTAFSDLSGLSTPSMQPSPREVLIESLSMMEDKEIEASKTNDNSVIPMKKSIPPITSSLRSMSRQGPVPRQRPTSQRGTVELSDVASMPPESMSIPDLSDTSTLHFKKDKKQKTKKKSIAKKKKKKGSKIVKMKESKRKEVKVKKRMDDKTHEIEAAPTLTESDRRAIAEVDAVRSLSNLSPALSEYKEKDPPKIHSGRHRRRKERKGKLNGKTNLKKSKKSELINEKKELKMNDENINRSSVAQAEDFSSLQKVERKLTKVEIRTMKKSQARLERMRAKHEKEERAAGLKKLLKRQVHLRGSLRQDDGRGDPGTILWRTVHKVEHNVAIEAPMVLNSEDVDLKYVVLMPPPSDHEDPRANDNKGSVRFNILIKESVAPKSENNTEHEIREGCPTTIWMRTRCHSASANSFHVSIDNEIYPSKETVCHVPVSTGFEWFKWKRKFQLEPGLHELVVGGREPGSALAAIWISFGDGSEGDSPPILPQLKRSVSRRGKVDGWEKEKELVKAATDEIVEAAQKAVDGKDGTMLVEGGAPEFFENIVKQKEEDEGAGDQKEQLKEDESETEDIVVDVILHEDDTKEDVNSKLFSLELEKGNETKNTSLYFERRREERARDRVVQRLMKYDEEKVHIEHLPLMGKFIKERVNARYCRLRRSQLFAEEPETKTIFDTLKKIKAETIGKAPRSPLVM
eukprot:g48.t1